MSRGRGSRLLLDTHIWHHYVSGLRDLPGSLRTAIDDAAGLCWLSPISLWELGMLARKGRLDLEPDPVRWMRDALQAFPVHEASLNHEVAFRVDELRFLHPDPADRFLAATASVYGLTLVTLDQRLAVTESLEILTA